MDHSFDRSFIRLVLVKVYTGVLFRGRHSLYWPGPGVVHQEPINSFFIPNFSSALSRCHLADAVGGGYLDMSFTFEDMEQ